MGLVFALVVLGSFFATFIAAKRLSGFVFVVSIIRQELPPPFFRRNQCR
jgi:hypothetical protein